MTITAVEAAVARQSTLSSRAADYGAGFRATLEQGRAVTGIEYAKAQARRAEWVGRIRESFREFDILACPSMPSEPFVYNPEDAYRGPNPATGGIDRIPATFLPVVGRFTMAFDFNGYPTLSVPCGITPDGVPLSWPACGASSV
jgi:Asp-tRNA(Asn)/Glu-tRNA(Gln) amidotransferase A subunit family amidase